MVAPESAGNASHGLMTFSWRSLFTSPRWASSVPRQPSHGRVLGSPKVEPAAGIVVSLVANLTDGRLSIRRKSTVSG